MKLLLFTLGVLIFSICTGQKRFSTNLGFGFGGAIEKEFIKAPGKGSGRITVFIAQKYMVSDNFSLSLELLTSGNMGGLLGGSGTFDYEDTSTNTIFINNTNLNANSMFLKAYSSFPSDKKIKFFIAFGLGLITYNYNINAGDTKKVKKSSLGISPEIGISIAKYQFACKAFIGGTTPSFTGSDAFSNLNLKLESVPSQQILFTMSFPVFSF